MQIDSTTYSGLKVYYPSTSSIGLFIGEEPDTSIETICFVCAASYTKSRYHHGLHSDIAGAHVVSGVRYDGYEENNNTGGFVSYAYPDNKWEILDRKEYLSRLNSEALPVTAFTQELLIRNGKKQAFIRKDKTVLYRALCSLNGRLCVIDGTHEHLLTSFVDLLLNIGVTDALYLDMGEWRYSWYLNYPWDDPRSKVTYIYPKPEPYYGSNWLVFYWVN